MIQAIALTLAFVVLARGAPNPRPDSNEVIAQPQQQVFQLEQPQRDYNRPLIVRDFQPSYNQYRNPRYDFSYNVQDNNRNNYGHQESRNGPRTQGTYYVQLPDGRVQRVTYYVDGNSGYVAEVTYEGEARFPHLQRQVYQQTYQPRLQAQSYSPSQALQSIYEGSSEQEEF